MRRASGQYSTLTVLCVSDFLLNGAVLLITRQVIVDFDFDLIINNSFLNNFQRIPAWFN